MVDDQPLVFCFCVVGLAFRGGKIKSDIFQVIFVITHNCNIRDHYPAINITPESADRSCGEEVSCLNCFGRYF